MPRLLACRLTNGFGSISKAVRAVVARLKLLPKLVAPEFEGDSSGDPFTGDAG